MKPVIFQGRAQTELRKFPAEARQKAGKQIMRLQSGLDPSDSKPMSSIGAGVREIRIRDGGQYRVVYVAMFSEAIYILSGFKKKSRATPKEEIEKARLRLSALHEHRRK